MTNDRADCPACGEERWRLHYGGAVIAGCSGTITDEPASKMLFNVLNAKLFMEEEG